MKMQSCLLLLTVSLLLVTLAKADELRQVIEICRHGARNLTNKNFTVSEYDIEGHGELTEVGKRQHYIWGRELRKRYIEDQAFLSPLYKATELIVKSTDRTRTLQSAEAQLLGLYPPGTGPILDDLRAEHALPPYAVQDAQDIQEELGEKTLPHYASPIPVQTSFPPGNYTHDYLLNALGACPNVRAIEGLTSQTTKIKEIETFFDPLKAELKQILNYNETLDLFNLYQIYDNIECNNFEGIPNKIAFTDDIIKQLRNATRKSTFNVLCGNETGVKLMNTFFFKEVVQLFNDTFNSDQKIITNEERLKFAIYSGHDWFLASILKGLYSFDVNYTRDEPIPFASNIIFELYRTKQSDKKEDYYVIAKFNDEELTFGEEELPSLSLDQFTKYLLARVFTEHKFETLPDISGYVQYCHFPFPGPDPYNKTIYLTISIVLAVCLLIILIISCIFVHKKDPENIQLELQGKMEKQKLTPDEEQKNNEDDEHYEEDDDSD
jgi:hypothetical protein